MNRIWISLLAFITISIFVACDSDRTAEAQTVDQESTTSKESFQRGPDGFYLQPGRPGQSNDRGNATDGAFDPLPPRQNRWTNALMRGYWVFEFFVNPDYPELSKTMKGTWYKFMPDGTFTVGRWQDQLDSGSWRFYEVKNKRYLLLDAMHAVNDEQYDLQGIATGDTEMTWVGTRHFKRKNNTQLKAVNLTSMPTRAQFGVTEE